MVALCPFSGRGSSIISSSCWTCRMDQFCRKDRSEAGWACLASTIGAEGLPSAQVLDLLCTSGKAYGGYLHKCCVKSVICSYNRRCCRSSGLPLHPFQSDEICTNLPHFVSNFTEIKRDVTAFASNTQEDDSDFQPTHTRSLIYIYCQSIYLHRCIYATTIYEA